MPVKKIEQQTKSSKSETVLKNNIREDKIKTTNVNILLNRVRLDEKKTLKKRIFFSIILITLVSLLAVYFTV
tara:strand:- start:116 stop:331 length:216 start_codon:yes stop_codon:yes gene_type:complete